MFKRKILPLLMVAAAVVLGLVMPILFPAFRGSLGNSTEALGLELNELSMSSGLTVLEKLTVLSQPDCRKLTVENWQKMPGQKLIYFDSFGGIFSQEQEQLLLSNGGKVFRVNHIRCTDSMENRWELYQDTETGSILGLALRFFWADELEATDGEEQSEAYRKDIAEKIAGQGLDMSDGDWGHYVFEITYAMLDTPYIGVINAFQGDAEVYFDIGSRDGEETATISAGYDAAGFWINCDKLF